MPAVRPWHALIPILPLLAGGDGTDRGDGAPPWPDAFVARLEALALLQTLNAELLSHDSATETLEQWCGAHRMATPPRIIATPMRVAPKTPSEAQRRELRVGPTEPVRYRHVELACGSRVLSRAENWYVPGRLSPAMNRALETTDAPFGAVVRSLHFQRRTLGARLLFSPLPPAWELAPAQAAARVPDLAVPGAVLEHRAVLALPDGTPISEVVETYTGEVLAFGTAPGAAPR
jgi:chorismate-pyruvate lyase